MCIVFQALQRASFELQPKNCRLFHEESLTYLRYKPSPEGIAADDNKLVAVRPETFTKERSFIAFCFYYRGFIKDFGGITKHLHQITKNNSRFPGSPECHNAFEKLKAALTDSSVLKHADYNSSFTTDTDINGIQNSVVIFSRVLTTAECRYSTTKRQA